MDSTATIGSLYESTGVPQLRFYLYATTKENTAGLQSDGVRVMSVHEPTWPLKTLDNVEKECQADGTNWPVVKGPSDVTCEEICRSPKCCATQVTEFDGVTALHHADTDGLFDVTEVVDIPDDSVSE